MSIDKTQLTTADPWNSLKRFTRARIALGRAGSSMPTKDHLEFQLAHALARDAVKVPLDFTQLQQSLVKQGLTTLGLQTLAGNRQHYLQRPDRGRLLNPASVEKVKQAAHQAESPDIVLIVADGLSSDAIANHAQAFISLLLPALIERQYTLSPICLVELGRVAIGDPIAEIFSARLCIVLIGERPGLSSPDSMGIYFTYQARTGKTDAERNCISNIHQNGLSYQGALQKLLFLIAEADRLQLSGVKLKDGTLDEQGSLSQGKQQNFLLE